MIVDRKEFMKVLTVLFPTLGKGDDNSANVFCALKDENNKSYMASTNNKVCAVVPVPFEIDTEFRVHGTTLFQLVKKFTKVKTLTLSVVAGNLFIESDGTETHIPLMESNRILLDYINFPEEDAFKPLPSNFNEALRFCSKFTKEEIGGTLAYTYAHKNTMCSATHSEIVLHKLDSYLEEKLFILPSDASNVSGFNFTHYAYGENSLVHFKTDTNAYITFYSAVLERFPVVITPEDYTVHEMGNGMDRYTPKALFNTDGMQEVYLTEEERKSVTEVLQTCSLFIEEGKEGVSCKFDGDNLIVSSVGKKGIHKQVLPISSFSLLGFTFETLPEMLIGVLKRNDRIFVGHGKLITKSDTVMHYIQVQ